MLLTVLISVTPRTSNAFNDVVVPGNELTTITQKMTSGNTFNGVASVKDG